MELLLLSVIKVTLFLVTYSKIVYYELNSGKIMVLAIKQN